MIKRLSDRPFLSGGLFAVVIIIGAALLSGGWDGNGGAGETDPASQARPVQTRDLFFRDQSDGTVAVFAAGRDDPIDVIPTGERYGFVRVVLRGLVRERKSQGLGPAQPFRVTRWSDGRVTLKDMATGRVVALNAFGSTNVAAFAQFLEAEGGVP